MDHVEFQAFRRQRCDHAADQNVRHPQPDQPLQHAHQLEQCIQQPISRAFHRLKRRPDWAQITIGQDHDFGPVRKRRERPQEFLHVPRHARLTPLEPVHENPDTHGIQANTRRSGSDAKCATAPGNVPCKSVYQHFLAVDWACDWLFLPRLGLDPIPRCV